MAEVEDRIRTCTDCNGNGMASGERCPTCNGQGFTRANEPAPEPEAAAPAASPRRSRRGPTSKE